LNADGPERAGHRTSSLSLGLGLFTFLWEGHELFVLHQTLGEPVGTSTGCRMLRSLTLLSISHSEHVLKAFCDALLEAADTTDAATVTVYQWLPRRQLWVQQTAVPARPLASVVLPSLAKAQLLEDLDEFSSDETVDWYRTHGIPHKRSYLFYGPPGAGKTSFIQAVAAKYGRSICFLSPTDPEMTDENLRAAVQKCPSSSILVLEDVDSFFERGRERSRTSTALMSFSGLLNALDGIGSASGGQIFILTTNKRASLDPALIRDGRVDMHIRFGHAEPEQMRDLFSQFYPEAGAALACVFEDRLRDALGPQQVSMAALQHYFVRMRKKSATEAAYGVQHVLDELQQRRLRKDE